MRLSKKYPQPHSQVAARVIDGQAIIITPLSGEIRILNEVGTRIWELADGRHSAEQIVAILMSEYAVSRDEAERDVIEFIEGLAAKQILVLSEHP